MATTKKEEKKTKKKAKKGKYYEAVGRRKTSVARVRLMEDDSGKIVINGKDYEEYLPTEELATTANAPLRKIKMVEKFGVTVVVSGGGLSGQAEAIRHGLARALVEYDPELRLRLKKSGYLKRDPRQKERKKYGLKKARKAPQWSKR
ncbi:MAG: 30S ribosomal protein S9 [Candidatus Spechtbacterales bacterium]|nr:30S ribosomal protein S9 [Candidatus Spechtbacterales bacterium]